MAKRAIGDENAHVVEPHPKRSKFSIDTLLDDGEDASDDSDELASSPPTAPSCMGGHLEPTDAEPEAEPVDELIAVAEKPATRPARTKEGNLTSVDCRLEGAELWAKFYDLGTEMIITKSGRRMFPTVKASLTNVDFDALYYIFLDVIPVDTKRYRYIYNKSAWLTAGKAEPAPRNRLYLHPDSPFTGEQLLKQVVSFEKAKLTNNEVDKTGHLILNSMHKYQPRIHVVRRDRHRPLDPNTMTLEDEQQCTFVFTETQFMAVTAYQNQLITKLKIEKNPFAKGFRDPSGRSPDYEPSNDQPTLVMPNMYPSALLQQALLHQYYAKARAMPPIGPALLSQMLLYQMPFALAPPTSASGGELPSPSSAASLSATAAALAAVITSTSSAVAAAATSPSKSKTSSMSVAHPSIV